MRQLGHATLRDPRARMILDRYATYTGSDPGAVLRLWSRSPSSSRRSASGMWAEACTPAEALYQRCLDLGTTFVFNTSVEQITTDAAGVTGVRIQDGSTVAADVVVADADARTVYGTLLQDRRTWTAAAACQDAALLLRFRPPAGRRRADPGIRHHNVWFPADYDAEFDQLFSKNPSPVSDPAIYACVPDDPAMRPDGAESWFILVNAPTQDPPAMDWSARSEDYADHVLAVLAERV